MSGNAALAAARRRRGEDPNQQIQSQRSRNNNTNNNNSLPTNRENEQPVSPLNVILEHDKQIFLLERKLEQLDKINNETAPEMSSELESLLLNNTSEIKLLKTT